MLGEVEGTKLGASDGCLVGLPEGLLLGAWLGADEGPVEG